VLHSRNGWMAALAIAILAIGCKPGSVAPTPTPATESRPEGLGRVVKVEPNDPIGLRLDLATGVVLTVGPPGSQALVQTATGPDSLAIYGHDRRGLWVLWLGLDPKHGPGCFALPKIGYDRQELIAWPGDGIALPKAATFSVEPGVTLGAAGTDLAGWYSTGGLVPQATFCVSSSGEVASVAP
jgi:hypothetical protein